MWNAKFRSAVLVHLHGVGFLSEWCAANPLAMSNTASSSSLWRRPSFGWVKCNVDAVVFEALNKLGHG